MRAWTFSPSSFANTMMNERLLETCRGPSPEQLAATTEGTFGSIGATLVHISNAQEGYAARILGTERPERLPEELFPGFDAVSERVREGNRQLEVLRRQRPDDSRLIEYIRK